MRGPYYVRFHTHRYHCYRELHFNSRRDVNFAKVTRSWCVLEECFKGNYNARFHTHRYHCYREMHFISRRDVNFAKTQWSVKCRSRAPAHGAWLKSVSRTITMQGFILPAITAAEKCTLYLDST